jgi:uncharacterized protein (TIGR01244 family)
MIMNKLILISFMFFTALLIAKDQSTADIQDDTPNYVENLFNKENIFIGGQPQETDFTLIKQQGFTSVINFRTKSEMDGLGYNEELLLKKAELPYHLIQIGGDDNPYSPDKLDEFASAMQASNGGKVLLHCRSGQRASQLWAAYLIKYKGIDVEVAKQLVSDFKWMPTAIDQLLGNNVTDSAINSK